MRTSIVVYVFSLWSPLNELYKYFVSQLKVYNFHFSHKICRPLPEEGDEHLFTQEDSGMGHRYTATISFFGYLLNDVLKWFGFFFGVGDAWLQRWCGNDLPKT